MNQPPHHRHRHRRSSRFLAYALLVVALLVAVVAASDFVYIAYQSSDCFVDDPDPITGVDKPRQPVASNECFEVIRTRDNHQRLDALVATLGIALMFAAGVVLSKAKHRVKRLVIGIEAVVMVLGLVYAALWWYAN